MSNIYANNINPRSGSTVTFPQNIKVLGTATYEDVANVDSVGIITAQAGVNVTGGTVTVGADPNDGVNAGTKLTTTGLVQATRSSGASAVFMGYTQNNSVPTLRINGNGSGYLIGGVGIGTNTSTGTYNSAADNLLIWGDGDSGLTIRSGSGDEGGIYFNDTDNANQRGIIRYIHGGDGTDNMAFHTSGGEACRIDSSKNFIVQGTVSEAIGGGANAIQSNNGISVLRRTDDAFGCYINLSKSRNTTGGQSKICEDNDIVGSIGWCADDGIDLNSPIAYISGLVDGTPAENSVPGALEFKTVTTGTGSVTRLRINANGTVVVGSSGDSRTGFFNVNAITPALQVETPGPSDNGRFSSIVSNAGSNAGYCPTLLFGKSRGTTVGSTNLLVSGDEIGAISFQGADGSQLVESARIVVTADGLTGADKMPGRISFQTTSDGASAPDRKLEILNNGLVWSQANTSGAGNTDRGFYHGYSSPETQSTGITMKTLGVGGGLGPFDTGVSVNAGNSGGVALLFATRNTGAFTATNGAVYIAHFYYSGDNTPAVTHLGGSDWVTWGKTAGNTLEASWTTNSNFTFGMIMLQ